MLSTNHGWNTSYKPLIVGLLLSLALTLIAYYCTVQGSATGVSFTLLIFGLSALQAAIQLILFLHVGIEMSPHWNFTMFLLTLVIIAIIVIGSIWIMTNLDYNMMAS